MRKIAIGLLLLALTACGGASPAASPNTDTTGSAPVAAPSAAPAGAASSAPAPSGGDTSTSGNATTGMMGDLGNIEASVATLLSTKISKPADTLKLQNKEQTEWSNGALGCPKQGMMYTEMIVPGFKLTYTDGSQTYDVHTDQTGKTAVWCDKGEPKPLS